MSYHWGYIIHSEFRSGNIAPADHNFSFIQRCMEQLPKTQALNFVRADSALYQHKLFDYCEEHGIVYTIGARLDSSVFETINEIQAWETMTLHEGKTHHLKEEVAECIHTMNNSNNAFRLIVVKKQIRPMLPTLEL